jgi:DNA ligase (NAD+)
LESLNPDWIRADSPTQWLVGQNAVQEWFEQAEHRVPLLSLQNTYTPQDLADRDQSIATMISKAWEKSDPNHENIPERTFHVEPKFDGISVELIYEDGLFVQAITRGDGRRGDDITANAKTISNLPRRLCVWQDRPAVLHVRAEIVMPKSSFDRLNANKIAQWEQAFVNPRNACAGSIKLLDPQEVAKRWLQVWVYDILTVSENWVDFRNSIASQSLVFVALKRWGLPLYPREQTLSCIDDVIVLSQDPQTKWRFDTQDVEFDGLVVKLDDLSTQQLLWSTNHHPRRAIAYKFPAQQVSTRLNEVHFQVGRTGILTPVALLEPISLSWVTISRASLHNESFIRDRDIHVGDYVRIQRSGEVIPYVVGVDLSRRDRDQISVIHFPSQCPECHQETQLRDEARYCTNPSCPAIVIEQIRHRASKDCLDIQWLWDRLVEDLVRGWYLHGIADLYNLARYRTALISLPGIGTKTIETLFEQIEWSKHRPLWRVLHGLWIPHVGKKLAQDLQTALIQHYGEKTLNRDQIVAWLSDAAWLATIYGIGTETIKTLLEIMNSDRSIIPALRAVGVWFELSPTHKPSGPLSWQIFCITGSFALSREQIIQRLEQLGAVYQDTVSKSLDFMLVWDKPWSKAQKAQSLWIPSQSLDELLGQEWWILIKTTKTDHKPVQESLF